MRVLTKGSIKALAIGIGAMMVSACGGHGPNTYLMPKEAVMEKLANASKHYTQRMGGRFDIRSGSWSGDRLSVTVTGSGGVSKRCEAIIEAIDEEWTRVTPKCGDENAEDVTDSIEAQINRMKVDEFVIAVLYDKPIDTHSINKRTSAVVIGEMGNIQDQAREEMLEAAEASERMSRGASSSGWGSSSDNSGTGW